MEPYFRTPDGMVALYRGDSRDLSFLPDGSVDCVVTSPPYWGLRVYSGNQQLVWGGNPECAHEWGPPIRGRGQSGSLSGSTLESAPPGNESRPRWESAFCIRCRAWKGAYGLEPTVEMYVEHTLVFLREIRRVLKPTGVVFWVIGDSYAGSGSPGGDFRDGKGGDEYLRPYNRRGAGLKPKDLCLVPFRVALAAQADGWWVRSVIIWAKPNPMPDPVRDRPIDAHDYILMLTKSRQYFWDAEAVRESYKENMLSVWSFPTQHYKGAHFAVFPEELVRRSVLVATSEKGVCQECGSPWTRIVSVSYDWQTRGKTLGRKQRMRLEEFGTYAIPGHAIKVSETIGWKPTCRCGKDSIPALVLDPFVGSGTTCAVAYKLGRRSVGVDISAEYLELAKSRLTALPLRMPV